jgi:S1-C subfamily serine protease
MTLRNLNEDIGRLAEKASESVVEVRARRGVPSSGVVFSEEGLVVTAEHTLEIEDGVEIATRSGDVFAAEILGRDPSTGIALLRAAKARLAPPKWRESPELGAFELALVVASSRAARPISLTTVTATRHGWNASGIDHYFETDARLFPGFSGSLLLDADGRGLGLNTAGLRQRTPLTIPAPALRRVARSLLDHGAVRRGFLGVTTYPVRLPEAVKSQRTGLLVLSVQEESPAAGAGLFLGDVILAVEREAVESPHALLRHLAEDRIGRAIELLVLRAGEEQRVSVTVGSRS